MRNIRLLLVLLILSWSLQGCLPAFLARALGVEMAEVVAGDLALSSLERAAFVWQCSAIVLHGHCIF